MLSSVAFKLFSWLMLANSIIIRYYTITTVILPSIGVLIIE